MDNIRDRLICSINSFYNNDTDHSIEKLADYLMEEIDELSKYLSNNDITIEEISAIIKNAQSKNNIRNLCMLYFVLVYGMKRDSLQNLKWNQFITDSTGKMFLYNYSIYTTKIPVPSFLANAIIELKEYYKGKKIKDVYIFCATKENGKRVDKGSSKIGEARINSIFNGFVSLLDEEKRYTPSNIRSRLPKFLLSNGCDLKEILIYFNIEFTAISNYVDENDLESIFFNDIKRTTVMDFWEEFMEKYL